MKTLFAITVSLSVLTPLGARAQSFTVLPVERDREVESSERMAAFTAVRSARVLGPSAQFEAVGQLVHRLPEDQRALSECLDVDCAAQLARGAGLDAVLVVAVWPGDDGRAASVAVTLVEPTGAVHEADAPVGEGGVSQAATTAVVAAARHRTLGDGVELRVRSSPEGALVLVDGTEVGVTPFVGAYEAGQHQVEVRLHGQAERREVVLEEDAVDVEVVLGGGSGEGLRYTDPQGRSAGSIIAPIGAGLMGLSSLAIAIASAAGGTECGGGAAGSCTRPNVGAIAAWASVGVALVATAVILWFVLDDSIPDSEAVALGVSPNGVRLRVPFDL